jgi:RNA polymerase sigma-70 factor (ECF subfamily)
MQPKEVFTKMYEEHSDALFRYCFFRVSDREKALDILQDIFTKTWNYMSEGNTIDNGKAFLYTTARHLIIDEYRKKKSSSLDALMDQGMEPSTDITHTIETNIDASFAVEEIKKLPDMYNDILFMRYVNDMSIRDIADLCKLNENVISVRIHRGLAMLRKNIKDK